MPKPILALPLSLGLILALPAIAQHAGHGFQGNTADAVVAAFTAANAKMHGDMAVPLSGNADVDFARAMIPHHEGAIAMAEIVLEHGADPEIRALAKAIVAAQEAEIAQLSDWLRRHAP